MASASALVRDDQFKQRLSLHRHFLTKKDLWREAAILSSVVYKNKNQHRRADYFRALEKVSTLDMLALC